MTKGTVYYLLDVFTDQVFAGNQLAVFPDARNLDSKLFQKIAGELNLSETVFLFPPENDKDSFSMRIFTPQTELPTAGHPTIGTAHYLATHYTKQPTLELDQKIGRIKVAIDFDGDLPGLISMYQPLPTFGQVYEDRKAIAEVLSVSEKDLEELPAQVVSCGNPFLFVPLKSKDALASIKVNTHALNNLNLDITGIYPFTISGESGGEVSGRMFAPGLGIVEDPATGSANGPLGCYLKQYTDLKFPLTSLQGFDMGRPSYLHLDIKAKTNTEINEVKISGKSRIIGKGELYLG